MAKREEGRGKFRWMFLLGTLICLVLGCSVNVSAKDARSDYSASELYSYNGHVYQLVYTRMYWPKANSYAKKLGGHLATITTADEQAFLTKIAAENRSSCSGDYWLGASDLKTEGTWKWVTGEKFDYTNWHSGEPNNGDGTGKEQDYLQMYGDNGLWDDAWNDFSLDTGVGGFIIEWDALSVEENLLELEVGDTCNINYSVNGSGTVSFKSSKNSVAKVSSKGKVIAKDAGVCRITVRYKNDSQTVVVVVTAKKASGLKKQSVTAKMVQLKWKSLSGVSGYQVWMYDPDVEEYVKVKTTSQTSATITGLDRGTKYKFKVRAYVKYGKKYYYGAYSKGITVATKK